MEDQKKYFNKSYNELIKWYDKQLNHLCKEQLIDLMTKAISDIEDDQFNTIK